MFATCITFRCSRLLPLSVCSHALTHTFSESDTFAMAGRAGGGPHPTSGHGEYTNTSNAVFGDLGSLLPYYPSGAVWKVGETVETLWSIRANHGGGWQYRLCPLEKMPCSEAEFQQLPMSWAADSKMMMSNGSMLDLTSTFVSEGTMPKGSTW